MVVQCCGHEWASSKDRVELLGLFCGLGVGGGSSRTSRPGGVAMVLEKMKHDRSKAPVGISYVSECQLRGFDGTGNVGDQLRGSCRTRSPYLFVMPQHSTS